MFHGLRKTIERLYLSPLLLPFFMTTEKTVIREDVRRWLEVCQLGIMSDVSGLLVLLAEYPEFRSLYYYRICKGNISPRVTARLLRLFHRGCPSLRIVCPSIGPGLFIQHGFCTSIGGERIGSNCWINQQVTVGWRGPSGPPIIGDNVRISAGAKVLGRIVVGNDVVVGANAVVIKNVPNNCVVVGNPSYIIRRNGVRVREPL